MIDSWGLAPQLNSQTVAPNEQDGGIDIQDIIALFLDSERKWR